jgi:hypothetical protein
MARTVAEGGKAQAALKALRGKSLPAEARRAKAGQLAGEGAQRSAGEGETVLNSRTYAVEFNPSV